MKIFLKCESNWTSQKPYSTKTGIMAVLIYFQDTLFFIYLSRYVTVHVQMYFASNYKSVYK